MISESEDLMQFLILSKGNVPAGIERIRAIVAAVGKRSVAQFLLRIQCEASWWETEPMQE